MNSRELHRRLRRLGETVPPPALAATVLVEVGLADGLLRLDSPVGRVMVAFNGVGVSALVLDGPAAVEQIRRSTGRPLHLEAPVPAGLPAAISARLEGRPGPELAFDLRRIGSFQRDVLRAALRIGRGQTRSYSWVASAIGRDRAVRAVGTALGRNPVPLLIPCHRVVRASGDPGRYALGSEKKRFLLDLEAGRIASRGGGPD